MKGRTISLAHNCRINHCRCLKLFHNGLELVIRGEDVVESYIWKPISTHTTTETEQMK
jgi:hypothetical protein